LMNKTVTKRINRPKLLMNGGNIYPLHLKMRFLTTHLASSLKRFSIEKLHNTTSIASVFLNQNASISGNLGVKISHLAV
ncbi:MAG: hypothetical protein WBE18_02980, partial [Gammaproteobacteria bacterium]